MTSNAIIFETGTASDVGLVRSVNEDSFIVRPGIGFWAVSDGMGGHSAGRLASNMVVDGLTGIESTPHAEDLVRECIEHLLASNARLRETSKMMGLGQAGATVVILVLHSMRVTCIWCGDSRIYRIRDGAIEQLTYDHSEAEELVRRGMLTPEQARTWPRKNVITKAIGVSDDPAPDVVEGTLQIGDTFVLCSDGLTNHLEDAEIGAACAEGDPQVVADRLIATTLERGARDNVTAVVVKCRQREPTVVDPTGGPRARLVQTS
jgi:protein phosphatase